MGNRHHGAFKLVQEALQPGHGLGVQVVGRFIQQQHIRLFQQQAAHRYATALAPGQIADFGIPVRQTHRIGGALQLRFQVMAVVRLDNFFQTTLFRGQFVEIGVRLGVERVNLIQALQRADHFRHCLFNGFADRLLRVELRLLRQIADFDTRLRTRFAFDVFIDARHNAQQRGFTRAVQTEHADFRAWEKAEGDVLQNMTLRRYHFTDAMHAIDELSHVVMSL